MSSEPHRNFFLIAMDGFVHKYDLVSKELLFQFKTNSRDIFLFDRDDKLIVANSNEIRLWNFYDHSDEAPELITKKDFSDEEFKIEHVFVNKNSKTFELSPDQKKILEKMRPEEQEKEDNEVKPLFVLATCKNKFKLFNGRLKSQEFNGQIEDELATITTAAFSKDSSFVLIGTSTGKIEAYSTSTNQRQGNPIQVTGPEFNVTKLVTLHNIEDQDVFIMITGKNALSLYIHDKKDTREIDFGELG